jgi:hypothetical protein
MIKIFKNTYYSREEATELCQNNNIRTRDIYRIRWKEFPGLPSSAATYKCTWELLLTGTEKPFYATLAEASEAAIKLGAIDNISYRKIYKQDTLLPSNPHTFYKAEWISWMSFLHTRTVEHWTEEEDDILRKYYPDNGLPKVIPLLPNKSRTSIYDRACTLGIKKYQNYFNKLLKICIDNGGRCLENNYLGWRLKHKFQCKKGHIWYAKPSSITSTKSWCPSCKGERGEVAVRQILERWFNVPFPTCRPAWLVNPKTGFKLELDGYNEMLKLAFEYQGVQHTKPDKYFGGEKSFLKQIERDEVKRMLCMKLGIKVIYVKQLADFKCKSPIEQHVYNCIMQQFPELLDKLQVSSFSFLEDNASKTSANLPQVTEFKP